MHPMILLHHECIVDLRNAHRNSSGQTRLSCIDGAHVYDDASK